MKYTSRNGVFVWEESFTRRSLECTAEDSTVVTAAAEEYYREALARGRVVDRLDSPWELRTFLWFTLRAVLRRQHDIPECYQLNDFRVSSA
ncbi:hypothetical protein AVEN_112459-1 [Araneus ventricosus]|uniref:Uncharacterized protein n=1 Tax=Araneus ventricosus TaxID=182803 RepID=A0A4Y2J364_ARAVE|nr:hypothetical protein AVEN_112459-1 [Araneus ventricosus]